MTAALDRKKPETTANRRKAEKVARQIHCVRANSHGNIERCRGAGVDGATDGRGIEMEWMEEGGRDGREG